MWVGLINELESLRAKFEVSRRNKTELPSSDPASNWPIYKYTYTHTYTHTHCVHAQSQSQVLLWDFKDYSPQAFLWISQARILEGVAVSFSRGSSWPRDQTQVSCIAGGSFITEQPGKALSLTTHTHVKQTYWFCFSEEPWLVQNLISFLLLPYWTVYWVKKSHEQKSIFRLDNYSSKNCA